MLPCSAFLSDVADNLLRYAIPDSTVIPAHGFITFYLDGEARQGSMHASFKADTDGESMYLSQKAGETVDILDSASFSKLVTDHSFGKYNDGTGEWQHMVKITPGQPNDPDRLEYLQQNNEFTLDIKIYPNPSDGNIFISMDENIIHTYGYLLDVTDICGKVVHQKVSLKGNNSIINLTDLDRGLYFVRIFDGAQILNIRKLLIVK